MGCGRLVSVSQSSYKQVGTPVRTSHAPRFLHAGLAQNVALDRYPKHKDTHLTVDAPQGVLGKCMKDFHLFFRVTLPFFARRCCSWCVAILTAHAVVVHDGAVRGGFAASSTPRYRFLLTSPHHMVFAPFFWQKRDACYHKVNTFLPKTIVTMRKYRVSLESILSSFFFSSHVFVVHKLLFSSI